MDIIVFSFRFVKCSQNIRMTLSCTFRPTHITTTTSCIFRNYAALIGVVSHDFFTELSNTEMEEGIAREQRDQMLQVNSYHIILELYSIMLINLWIHRLSKCSWYIIDVCAKSLFITSSRNIIDSSKRIHWLGRRIAASKLSAKSGKKHLWYISRDYYQTFQMSTIF